MYTHPMDTLFVVMRLSSFNTLAILAMFLVAQCDAHTQKKNLLLIMFDDLRTGKRVLLLVYWIKSY